MKRIILLVVVLGLMLVPLIAAAETRTYTETVTVKVVDDEYSALNKAKERAREQALRSYLNDVYKDRAATLNLTGDEKFIQDMEQLESSTSGMFDKELKAKFRVTINEEEVRAYLKRQGAVTGKNEDRRIVVMLIPGKMDSGDAPVILDNIRAEIRRSLTAAEYTVIDSDDQAVHDALTEEADYNKLVSHINKIADTLADKGEWLVLGKVDMDIVQNGGTYIYRAMMTGKAVSLTSRDIMWEGNIDGAARGSKNEAKAALRLSAINGGKAFASEVLGALNTKTLTQERRGSRFEVVFAAGGDYKLERKILKLLKEDIKGLKDVSQKGRGKGDMVIDLMYVGKISDLVDLLLDNFEKDSQMKSFNPEIAGNKVIFKKR
jgi:transposase